MPETLEQLFGAKEEAPATDQLSALAEECLALRARLEAVEQEAKLLREQTLTREGDLLLAMEQAKLKSIRLDSGHLCTSVVKHKYSLPPKAIPELRLAALKWLRRVGARSMIEEDIHYQRLQAFLRERAEEKKPISDLIQVFEQKSLSVRKQ